MAVASVLLLGACGGGDDGDNAATMSVPASPSPFGGGTPPSASRSLGDLPPEFVQCMADRGFRIKSEFEIHSAPPEALQACLGSLHG
jgi:hypothetical protein